MSEWASLPCNKLNTRWKKKSDPPTLGGPYPVGEEREKKEERVKKLGRKRFGRCRTPPNRLHCFITICFFTWKRYYEKSRQSKGLPSADRNNKATLLLTGPFCTAKSSAKDLIPRVSKLQYAKYHLTLLVRRNNRRLRCEAGAYSYPSTTCGRYHRVLAWILT